MEMTKRPTTPEDQTIIYGNHADIILPVVQLRANVRDYVASTETVVQSNVVCAGLSPRLEMRLALNRDIMGDEDLINYAPGPDLTTILGHNLTTYHRMTARDILNHRTVNHRTVTATGMGTTTTAVGITKEQLNTISQQRNSKLDTPTPNRKKSSPSTWNSSVSVDRGKCYNLYRINISYFDFICLLYSLVEENALTDLERLAKREKIFCMSQLRSGRVVPQPDRTTTRKMGRDRDENVQVVQYRNRKNKL